MISKQKAAGLSILSNTSLVVLKIIAGSVSGSLSIISEAVHSFSDLSASIFTYFSVYKSSQPADSDHPYGHGKYEDMAGFIEGILIILAAIFILYESSKKIITGNIPATENTIGIAIMSIAVITNYFVSAVLFNVAQKHKSISIYADAEHLRTDVYSSLGVLIGLILIKVTGYTILDSIIAIIIAVVIYKVGYNISKKAIMHLLDYSISQEDILKITQIIKSSYENIYLKENSLKARQVGPSIDIDMTLQFSQEKPICECHKICEDIESKIKNEFPNSTISIHAEPICYTKNCQRNCTEQF